MTSVYFKHIIIVDIRNYIGFVIEARFRSSVVIYSVHSSCAEEGVIRSLPSSDRRGTVRAFGSSEVVW